MKICSFDIFDTTLARICGSPANIFLLTGKKLFEENTALANEYFLIRNEAERTARLRTGKKIVSLDEIFDSFSPSFLNRHRLTKHMLTESEIETEKTNLVPIQATVDLISKYRADGYKIIFISDMYLPKAFLSETLREAKAMDANDDIFISADYGADKYSGKLYRIIRDIYTPSEWIHFGDNLHSDVKMAKREGIKAKHLHYPYTSDEQKWVCRKEPNEHLATEQIIAGIARATRLSFPYSPQIDMAANLIATSYIPFIKWLLNDTYKKQVSDIYFFARDGHIFHSIATQLNTNPNLKLHYLYISRKAVYLPYLGTANASRYIDCIGSFSGKSPVRILKTFSIPSDLYSPFLNKYKLAEQEPLTKDTTELFRNMLEDKIFRERVQEISTKARKNLLGYLCQEGLTSEKSVCVDLGWKGSTRKILNRILDEEGKAAVLTYYWGVIAPREPYEEGEYKSFVYLENYPICKKNIRLMEHYFSCNTEGSTIGYEYQNGKYSPLLTTIGSESSETALKKEIQTLNEAVCQKYAQYTNQTAPFIPDIFNVMKTIGLTNLVRLQSIPTRKEITLLRSTSIEDSLKGQYSMIRKLNPLQTLSAFLSGTVFNNDLWIEASILYTYKLPFLVRAYQSLNQKQQKTKKLIKKMLNGTRCH